mmetsp:Transcript_15576/g.59182  ORF Transcript_15576/g.59182 Transcript_15576/m.59182 type:complete len:638 (-) Transcript_15576:573-2486(-)|eukprot:scaffold3726_cov270-Pinguiococcus_pyrenoidosus.AAC.11
MSSSFDIHDGIRIPTPDADGSSASVQIPLAYAVESGTDQVWGIRDDENDVAVIDVLYGRRTDGTITEAEMSELRARLERRESREKERRLRRIARQFLITEALRKVDEAESVALLFLLDATGSMGTYIDGTKAAIRDIVEDVKKTHSKGEMYVGIVCYRDFGDGSSRFQMLNFVHRDHLDQFETFLSGVVAKGGGDTAEDVCGGLSHAAKVDWNVAGENASRVLVHIADSPGHGERYHDGVNDEYAKRLPKGGDAAINPLPHLQKLRRLNVEYVFGEVTTRTRTMIRVFNRDLGGMPYVKNKAITPETMGSTVTSEIRDSIMRSSSRVSSAYMGGGTLTKAKPRSKGPALGSIAETPAQAFSAEDLVLEGTPPAANWYRVPECPVTILSSNKIGRLSDLRNRDLAGFTESAADDGDDGTTTVMQIMDKPFSQGSCRWAFLARQRVKRNKSFLDRLRRAIVRKVTFQPKLISHRDFVVKRFKGSKHHLSQYLAQITSSTVASFLAERYNQSAVRKSTDLPIYFLQCHVVAVHRPGAVEPEYFTAEKLLPSSVPFRKYANNVGHVLDSHVDETLLKFIKFTYDITDGYLMVSDLQGVRLEDKYVLTDPVILCQDLSRFGDTNFGSYAMLRFLKTINDYRK